MKYGVVYLLIISVCIEAINGQNYCNSNVCPSGRRHIMCNGGRFGSQCPRNARVVPLSAQMKNLIVHMHNLRRSRIALGEFSKFDTASRMPTMQWSDDLARIALLNAKSCVMRHDQCRNTPRFLRAGQNIGQTSSRGQPNRLRRHLINTINGWFSEYKIADMSIINSFQNPKTVGHFTAMMNDRATHVGCGSVRFIRNRRNTLITTCNYAATNYFNNPVYKTGQVGSLCTTGLNTRYRGLCSRNEVVDPNVA